MDKKRISVAVMIILYVVGIVGIGVFQNEAILQLTPIHLLVTLTFLFLHHRHWKHWPVFIITYAIGFGIELIGVNTGWPFGSYSYGSVLGPLWMGTPWMIGVNWLILTYGAVSVVDALRSPAIVKALLASLLMVLLDVMIEPVAIDLHFWTWESKLPPVQNYVGWFAVAVLICGIWFTSKVKINRWAGRWIFILQAAFFASLLLK